MLHIILWILKLIVIILLALLGFLLISLLIILAAPVGYRAKGSFYGKMAGYAKVSWLFHLISIKASYDEKLEVCIRLLGVRLRGRKKRRRAESGEKSGSEVPHRDKGEPKPEDLIQDDLDEAQEEPLVIQEIKGGESEQAKPFFQAEMQKTLDEAAGGPFRFLKKIRLKCETWMRSFLSFIKNIPAMFQKGIANAEKIREMAQDEANKKTCALIWRQLKKLKHHVLPRKLKGSVTFGFEDPYTTGQMLSWASIFYPFYYKNLTLTPAFDRVVLEGRLELKGRICLGAIVAIVLRVYFDKNFRMLWKRWMG